MLLQLGINKLELLACRLVSPNAVRMLSGTYVTQVWRWRMMTIPVAAIPPHRLRRAVRVRVPARVVGVEIERRELRARFDQIAAKKRIPHSLPFVTPDFPLARQYNSNRDSATSNLSRFCPHVMQLRIEWA